MNTTSEYAQAFVEVITRNEKILKACNKKIERLSHPELYGCCLSNCNSIVINKERMMVVTTDSNHYTTYEFSPLYPTYFSPEAAKKIVASDIYKDCNGNRIELEIIGELEYYKLLKKRAEADIRIIESLG